MDDQRHYVAKKMLLGLLGVNEDYHLTKNPWMLQQLESNSQL